MFASSRSLVGADVMISTSPAMSHERPFYQSRTPTNDLQPRRRVSLQSHAGETLAAPSSATDTAIKHAEVLASNEGTQNTGAEAQSHTPLCEHGSVQRIKTSDFIDAGHESADSFDSEMPLEVVQRGRRSRRPPLFSSDDEESTDASNPPHNIRRLKDSPESQAVLVKTEAEEPSISATPATPAIEPLFKGSRYKADVDWIDECQRCIKKGTRCFTAAGSPLNRKRCNECVDRHRLCIVDGINVSSEPLKPASKPEPKSQRKAQRKQLTCSVTPAKKKAANPRRSSRQTVSAQHVPVLLSVGAKSETKTQKRKRRSRLTNSEALSVPKTGSQTNAESLADSSSLSSVPASDTEDRADGPVESTRVRSELTSIDALSAETQQRGGTEASKGQEKAPVGQTAASQPVAKAFARQTDEGHPLARYMTGLMKDIASAIRRCLGRFSSMQDHEVLLTPDIALDVLVGELEKLLDPAHQGSIPSYWILSQLAEYLHRIRKECQEAKEGPDAGDRRSRQAAAVIAVETLFDRCLTLISMHIGQASN